MTISVIDNPVIVQEVNDTVTVITSNTVVLGNSVVPATPTVSGTVKIDAINLDPVVYLKASVDTLLLSYLLNSNFTWTNLSGKPSTFTPSAHTHPESDVTSLITDLGVLSSTISSEATTRASGDTTNASNLTAHANLTTTAHGGIVASSDARLSDARTPLGHHVSHETGGTDVVTVTKSQVGLGNVENTALSTWIGSTNVTTLGTIVTGVWNGTLIGSSKGGTGVNNGSNLLTVPKTGTAALGTGTAGRVAEWVTDANTLQASTIAKTGAGLLTIVVDVAQTFRSDTNGNISFGAGAGAAFAAGTGNLTFGTNAGRLIAGGSANFALGDSSLFTLVSGSFNVGIGQNALLSATGTAHIGIGRNAGLYIGAGNFNVIIGSEAGSGTYGAQIFNTDNVMIGYGAGQNMGANTSRCVLLGYQAGQNETGSDKLYIEPTNSARPLIKGDFSADTLTFYATDAATNAVRTVTSIDYSNGAGTPAAGFGARDRVLLRSSTTDSQVASARDTLWATATHASFKARVIDYIGAASGLQEWLRGETDGSNAMVGFLGATAKARQTVVVDASDLATAITLVNDIKAKLGQSAGFGLFAN